MAFFHSRVVNFCLCLVFAVCVDTNANAFNAENITLASNGKAHYTISYPPTASLTEKFATKELKKYLNEISGANFICSDALNDYAIIVSSTDGLQKFVPDVAIPGLEKEEYGIFKRDNNLFLIGGSDRAVLYAVYDFLGRLGCHWIAPDFSFYENENSYIPSNTELTYSHFKDIVERPVLKYRKLYIEEGRSHNTPNLLKLIDWMPKNRFNVLVAPINYRAYGRVKWDNWREELIPALEKRGIIIEVGGHGYQNFLNSGMENGKLFQNHPEWFGMAKDGQRSNEKRMVFCTSNPEAVAYLHHNILTYLQNHPEIRIFDFWPPDSEVWCECPSCTALGTATDRHALLVSQTAQFLQREYPEVRLECIAYSRYTEPPQNEVLDKNILLDFCPIRQSFEYQIYEKGASTNEFYKAQLTQWRTVFEGDISIYSYYRKYAWSSLPNIIPHYMQNDLRFYSDIGVKGISVYSEPGDWFTYGLNHYVLGQLAWQPDVAVDSLVAIYCSNLYGPASKLAAQVYSTLEDVVRFGCDIPHTRKKSTNTYRSYVKKIGDAERKVKAAMKSYTANTVLYRHLNRLALMLNYAAKDIVLTDLKANGGTKEEVAKLSGDIKKLISENAHMGVFIKKRF